MMRLLNVIESTLMLLLRLCGQLPDGTGLRLSQLESVVLQALQAFCSFNSVLLIHNSIQ